MKGRRSMFLKRVAAILLAAVTILPLTALPSEIKASAVDTQEQYVSNNRCITVNSYIGQTEDDIQLAFDDLRGSGGTVKLIGNFSITKTLVMYSNQTLDASSTTLQSSLNKVIFSHKMRNVIVRGGTWKLSGQSMLLNFNRCIGGMVDSVTTSGGGYFGFGGIYLSCCRDITVTNCRLSDIDSEGIYSYRSTGITVTGCNINKCNGHGLRMFGSSGLKLYGNKVNYPCGDGVSISQCDDVEISGNTFTNVKENNLLDIDPTRNQSRAGCGILVSDSADVIIGQAVTYGRFSYEGNTVSNCANYGMHITTSTNTFVNKTDITSVGSDGIHNSASSYTVIQNCKISDCGETAISMLPGPQTDIESHLIDCRDSVITNNTISNCGRFGIFLSLTVECSVSYNDIRSCKDYGIYSNGAKNVLITDGTIYNTKTYNGSGIRVSANSVNVLVDVTMNLDKSSLSIGTGETYQLTSSNNTVKWKSSDTSVASVTSDGLVRGIKSGTAWITATSMSGKTASCQVTVKSAPTYVNLNYTNLTVGVGESYTLRASISGNAASAARTFRTSNSSIVRLTKTNWEGTFVASKPGTAWVTVRLYNGLEASCKIVVKNAPDKVSLNKTTLTLGHTERYSLNAVLPSGTASSVKSFRSSNENVVRMTRTSGYAEFTGVGLGTAWVTVRLYNGKEASCLVTVKYAPGSVSMNMSNISLQVGQSATVSAVLPQGAGSASRTYRSSNSSIVRMTKTDWTGKFVAVKKGTAWVTVRLFNGAEASCKVTVY